MDPKFDIQRLEAIVGVSPLSQTFEYLFLQAYFEKAIRLYIGAAPIEALDIEMIGHYKKRWNRAQLSSLQTLVASLNELGEFIRPSSDCVSNPGFLEGHDLLFPVRTLPKYKGHIIQTHTLEDNISLNYETQEHIIIPVIIIYPSFEIMRYCRDKSTTTETGSFLFRLNLNDYLKT